MEKKTASAIMLTLLLTSMLTLAFNIQSVKAEGTIYIRADGSIDPPTAPISTGDNVTYTFTGNINDSIVVERSNILVDGSGYMLQGSGSGDGFYSSGINNVTIKNTNIKNFTNGIHLYCSSSNSISGNNVTNSYVGIGLGTSSNYSSISGNNITANNGYGVYLYHSSSNSISGNNIANNSGGIALFSSSNCSISGNNIANKYYYGIYLHSSSNNRFYHNNLIDNTQQVYFETTGYANVWDDGYPSGGNYWSDYAGSDLFSGSNQNELGNDGIGDTPYIIDSDNLDRYPLMIPWGMSYSGYDWPMFHHDERHTGYSSSIAPNNNATLWTFDVYDARSPAIANGKVFVGSILGNVYALDASTGAVVWSAQKGGEAWAAPAVAYGKVFIGYTYTDMVGVIWALNETSGAEVWSYQLESYAAPVLIAPTVAYGNVFIGPCANSKVYALNATTGELLWSYATGGGERNGPRPSAVVMNNVVYVGSEDFKMYALNATNGTLIWNFTTGNYIVSSPALSDGRVFVSSEDGRLYALNQTTGEQLWNSSITSLDSSPAVADGIIFVGNQALNETTGKLIWSSTIGPTSSSPAVADNKVFVSSYGGGIFALDKTTGAEIWSFKPQGVSKNYNSPAVAYGKVFICLGSTLYAFGVHDIKVADVKPGKTVIGQNFTARIYVNITNEGGYKESFNVTVSANSSIIGAETIELMSGSSANMTFIWNTSGFAKGNYTISASATAVWGETDTADNNFTDGTVLVSFVGDVNGDRKVRIDDVLAVAQRFGTDHGGPPNSNGYYYDANCDINDDLKIRVDDVLAAAQHFGQGPW